MMWPKISFFPIIHSLDKYNNIENIDHMITISFTEQLSSQIK